MTLDRETVMRLIKDGKLGLTPFDKQRLQPRGYTFTLAAGLRLPQRSTTTRVLDLRQHSPSYHDFTMDGRGYELQPGGFVLGEMQERLILNGLFSCALSACGQMTEAGLDVLPAEALAEPEADQPQVVKIRNHGGLVVLLYPGMPCLTGVFFRME